MRGHGEQTGLRALTARSGASAAAGHVRSQPAPIGQSLSPLHHHGVAQQQQWAARVVAHALAMADDEPSPRRPAAGDAEGRGKETAPLDSNGPRGGREERDGGGGEERVVKSSREPKRDRSRDHKRRWVGGQGAVMRACSRASGGRRALVGLPSAAGRAIEPPPTAGGVCTQVTVEGCQGAPAQQPQPREAALA